MAGRNITLFPDKGAFEKWNKKVDILSHFAKFAVSDLLERKNAAAGTDFTDYLTENFPEQKKNPLNVETKNMDSFLKGDTDKKIAYYLHENW